MNILEISSNECIDEITSMMKSTFEQGNSLYCFGNGGAASGCDHFVGELNKSFIKKRDFERKLNFKLEFESKLEASYRAVSLCSNVSLITAIGNDIGFEYIFAQQLYTFGNDEDIAIGVTTSGRSENIVLGLETAKALGMKTVLITGNPEIEYDYIDLKIETQNIKTAEVQEEILMFLHNVCRKFEN